MEQLSEFEDNNDNHNLNFFGSGSTYFGIVALNIVLTILTLGLYYPWAKAAYRKYLWNETEFKESRFIFNGTGREMFKGFLIAYLIIIGFYTIIIVGSATKFAVIFILLFYIGAIIFFPFAIYGGWKYRISRTSWRGVFFNFDGNFKEFIGIYFKSIFFTIITFGIYGAWMRVKLQKYLFSHTKIGHLRFGFAGKGEDLFVINLLAGILYLVTFGLYIPVWIKNRFTFTISNTFIDNGEIKKRLKTDIETGEAWVVIITNVLLLIVTAGLAFPWATMRFNKLFFESISLPEEFDYDTLEQSDKSYKDATGDEMADIFDIDFDF